MTCRKGVPDNCLRGRGGRYGLNVGLDFDELVRGEDTRSERERDSVLTFALALLVGVASMVITLAIHRPECLGGGFLQCSSEGSTQVPYMLVGIVVAGAYGGFVLWATRRRGSGLSDRALAWAVVPVVALSVGAAVQVPLMLLLFFYPPAIVMVVTAIAVVVSFSAFWDLRRGRRKPISPVMTVAPTATPLVTVTRRPPNVPLLWVARCLWAAPLGLLITIMTGGTCFVSGDVVRGWNSEASAWSWSFPPLRLPSHSRCTGSLAVARP